MWLVNGELSDKIAAADRGLAYGDGVFETMAWLDGQVRAFAHHWERLNAGCNRLGIAAPDRAVLESEIVRVANAERCVIKIIVSRGASGRGYGPDPGGVPTRVVAGLAWPAYPQRCWTDGVTVGIAQTRLAMNPALAGIKHLNRLEQVLGARERQRHGWDEAVMLDYQNHVIGGTMSNIFLVLDGELRTPGLQDSGIRGVTRTRILAAARRMGVASAEATIDMNNVLAAEEVFLSNALIGIWPVARVAERIWQPGPVTRMLMEQVA